MKICLYSPYVPKHFGGGEKYFFDVARTLAKEHRVQVVLPASCKTIEIVGYVKDYEHFLQRSLKDITFIPGPLYPGSSALKKFLWTRKFDLCIAVTDGSMFFSGAKKNILHIQIPFTNKLATLSERLKLNNWSIRNTNSLFTKQIVEKSWRTKIQYVHYPAIDQACFQPTDHKEKIILSVGRFFRQLHTKRQDILVQAFAQLKDQQPELLKGWKLVLVGGVEDESYLKEVKQFAKGLPVQFYHQLSRKELLQLYSKAIIYWHAAGYQVDQEKHPEQVEHFGISTAEAMASGCIPIVVGKGGQLEVVGEDFKDFQWQSIEECCHITTHVLQYPNFWPDWQRMARQQVQDFSEARFCQTLYEMIGR